MVPALLVQRAHMHRQAARPPEHSGAVRTRVIPALLVLWIRTGVDESPIWLERQRYLKERGGQELADRVSILRLFQPDLLWVTVQSSLLLSAFMFSY